MQDCAQTTTKETRWYYPKEWFSTVRQQSPSFLASIVILLLYLFIAVTGPWWVPYSANEMLVGRPYTAPSTDYLLGTDNFGRDIFSRVILGTQVVLGMALTASMVATIVGGIIGLLLGYLRGWIDEGAMRVIEVLVSIPPLILALLVLGILGSSPLLIISTVAFFYIPRVTTVVRAATLDVVTNDFITIARLRGESAWSIAVQELLPNVLGTVMVEFSLRTGYAVIFIGALGFLGFGAPPPSPEWGLMINEGRNFMSAAPWNVLGPSLAMLTFVVALSLFTEGLTRIFGRTARREQQ